MSNFKRGYVSFSGMDVKAIFGDKEIGKLNEIKYEISRIPKEEYLEIRDDIARTILSIQEKQSFILMEPDTHPLQYIGIPCTLRCPNCGEEFRHYGKYDEDIERLTKCPHCGYTVSKWCFDYVPGEDEDEEATVSEV